MEKVTITADAFNGKNHLQMVALIPVAGWLRTLRDNAIFQMDDDWGGWGSPYFTKPPNGGFSLAMVRY